MVGSEMLNVFGDSWFSAKTIQVVRFIKKNDLGRALINLGGRLIGSFDVNKTYKRINLKNKADRLRARRL